MQFIAPLLRGRGHNDDAQQPVMARPSVRRRRPDASTSQTISNVRLLFLFVVAFFLGYSSSNVGTTTKNENSSSSPLLLTAVDSYLAPFSTNKKTGWNSIHVFVGDSTASASNTNISSWQSQVHQDQLVAALLPSGRTGYFIDLAANEAVQWSNTYGLERELGWTGLCIEPTARYWQELVYTRTCQVVAAVVGNTTHTLVPWKKRKAYSGIVGMVDNPLKRNASKYLRKTTIALVDVLEHLHMHNQRIDYLSLDVEGAEEMVLLKFDLQRYPIQILTIERPSQRLMDFLQTQNYKLLATLSSWGETLWAHHSVKIVNATMFQEYHEQYGVWDPETYYSNVGKSR